MIKDEKLGLVIADNEIEKRWIEIIESCEKEIANLDKMLWFQKQILELARANVKGN